MKPEIKERADAIYAIYVGEANLLLKDFRESITRYFNTKKEQKINDLTKKITTHSI